VGHEALFEMRNSNQILVEKVQGKIPLARSKRRWIILKQILRD
jgi:hypothetical protein